MSYFSRSLSLATAITLSRAPADKKEVAAAEAAAAEVAAAEAGRALVEQLKVAGCDLDRTNGH